MGSFSNFGNVALALGRGPAFVRHKTSETQGFANRKYARHWRVDFGMNQQDAATSRISKITCLSAVDSQRQEGAGWYTFCISGLTRYVE
jgi:hypothetical protein